MVPTVLSAVCRITVCLWFRTARNFDRVSLAEGPVCMHLHQKYVVWTPRSLIVIRTRIFNPCIWILSSSVRSDRRLRYGTRATHYRFYTKCQRPALADYLGQRHVYALRQMYGGLPGKRHRARGFPQKGSEAAGGIHGCPRQ